MLIVSNFLLWIVVLLQMVAIVAMGRRLRTRGPSAAAGSGTMPVGWQERFFMPAAVAAGDRSVPAPASQGEADCPTMLFYMTAGCHVGKRLIPDADLMARTEGMRFVLARDEGGAPAPFQPLARTRVPGGRRSTRGGKAGAEDGQQPYVMIIDRSGDVAAQGRTCSRADLARLLASASLGGPPLRTRERAATEAQS